MFLRLLFESFRRQKRRKTIALLAITLGMAVATAMIAMSAGVGDKISRELRATGANLILTPVDDTLDVNLGGVDLKPASEGRFIAESDLPKLKSIFWRNNITGFAPFLSDQVTFSKSQQTFKAELIGTYFSQTVRYGQDIFTTGVRSVTLGGGSPAIGPKIMRNGPRRDQPMFLSEPSLLKQGVWPWVT